jgi:uncharacterized protein involved in type VI secretion and phage assembly
MSIFEQFDTTANWQQKARMSRFGVTLAKVTNINDPEKLGRIKCTFLTANSEAKDMDWAYVMTPFGGKDAGFFFMPNEGDLVLVVFEGGDIHRPYIIGSLWGKLQDPPVKLKEGKNETYMIKTPGKNVITLSDEKSKEAITVETPKGQKVTLDDEKEFVQIGDKSGKNSIKLDSKSGEVSIKCEKKLTITVGSNAKITIDGMSGAITIEGKQSVKIDGAQINIEAKGAAKLKANGQLSVESSGLTTVKGSMLKLN